jgi:hypothetical protein
VALSFLKDSWRNFVYAEWSLVKATSPPGQRKIMALIYSPIRFVGRSQLEMRLRPYCGGALGAGSYLRGRPRLRWRLFTNSASSTIQKEPKSSSYRTKHLCRDRFVRIAFYNSSPFKIYIDKICKLIENASRFHQLLAPPISIENWVIFSVGQRWKYDQIVVEVHNQWLTCRDRWPKKTDPRMGEMIGARLIGKRVKR